MDRLLFICVCRLCWASRTVAPTHPLSVLCFKGKAAAKKFWAGAAKQTGTASSIHITADLHTPRIYLGF